MDTSEESKPDTVKTEIKPAGENTSDDLNSSTNLSSNEVEMKSEDSESLNLRVICKKKFH